MFKGKVLKRMYSQIGGYFVGLKETDLKPVWHLSLLFSSVQFLRGKEEKRENGTFVVQKLVTLKLDYFRQLIYICI